MSKAIEFKLDWPSRGHDYNDSEVQAVVELLRDNNSTLSQSVHVQSFEQEFASYIKTPHAYALMSCAHALDIAALLLNIQSGDEVIIPSHTYCATALAFARRGAKIVWADIDPDSLTMSPEHLINLISSHTKAIVIVHLYGLLSPHIEQISKIATSNNIPLIEDCAQSLGSKLDSSHSGTFGDIGCFSFHSQKNMTTLGEGGMIVTNNSDFASRIPGLRHNGHSAYSKKSKYWLPSMVNVDRDIDGAWPTKSTMSEAQALIGRRVLRRLDEMISKRRARACYIRKEMEQFKEVRFQSIYAKEGHSHHLLPFYYSNYKVSRDQLIEVLSSRYGIKAIIQYHPLHRYDLFVKTGHGVADVPVTDEFFSKMVSLPFSLTQSDNDFEYLVESLRNALLYLRE